MAYESLERSPYLGPRSFGRHDRGLFFGREREVRDLVSLVIAHPVVLLYGPSGAGKTSLVNAGLAPLLEEEGFEILPPARVGGQIPADIQPEAVPNPYVLNTLMSWAPDEADPRGLVHKSLADFLNEREHPTDDLGQPSPRVAIFDQFEELLTFYPERWPDRMRFFEQLREALDRDSLLRVVLAMREDYLAQLDRYMRVLPKRAQTRFRLERLREGGALAAATGPIEGTGRAFAPGVAEALVGDLMTIQVETASGQTEAAKGEFVEPVQLQVACRSLWEYLPPEATVISQDYLQKFGAVGQALADFYETAIRRAVGEAGLEEGDLRAWFEHNLITPVGTRGTVYRGPEQTGGIANPALDVLEAQHLVRGEWRAGARWYELTHDRFIVPIQGSNALWRAKEREAQLAREAARAEELSQRLQRLLALALVVLAALASFLMWRNADLIDWLFTQLEGALGQLATRWSSFIPWLSASLIFLIIVVLRWLAEGTFFHTRRVTALGLIVQALIFLPLALLWIWAFYVALGVVGPYGLVAFLAGYVLCIVVSTALAAKRG